MTIWVQKNILNQNSIAEKRKQYVIPVLDEHSEGQILESL
jgi:hypothetical protein